MSGLNHTDMFEDYLLVRTNRHQVQPKVYNEVRLVAKTGEEILATITSVNLGLKRFDCRVLDIKPRNALFPEHLDNISFTKIRFLYEQGKGLLP